MRIQIFKLQEIVIKELKVQKEKKNVIGKVLKMKMTISTKT